MRQTRVFPAISVLACSTLLAAASPAAAQVRFKSGVAELPKFNDVGARLGAVQALTARGGDQRIVVQFSGPVSPAQKAELARAGLKLQTYLGDNAYFAKVSGADLNAQKIAEDNSLQSLAAIERPWKMHPLLLEGASLPWAVVDDRDPKNPVIGAYVLFHEDAPMGLAAIETIRRHGGIVRSELMTLPAMVIEIPAANLAALADEPDVQWIEPPLPQLSDLAMRNDSNRALTGADIVHTAPYNLDGSGVRVFVFDGGRVRATHEAFGGRVTNIDSDVTSSHATHVAGTIGGNGASTSGQLRKGMAPGVSIISAGFQWGAGGIFLYTNPGDIENDYTAAINQYGAHISNNSIGTNTETNPSFPCSIQGDYGLVDSIIDSIVRGSLSGGAPFRVVWAAGNERQGSRCDVEGFGDYYSIAPPAGAKNHLTVGAINSNDDSMTSFSSWGPTDDGRMKPDVCAPGCEVGGDLGVTSATSSTDTSYGANCGTSMASPTVCGLAALVLQDFRARFPGLPDPRNSTLRALFAHTAQDLLDVGPDYRTGYGSVRIQPAIDLLRSGKLQEAQVGQGETFTTQIQVAGGSPLKVTLAWDDVPAAPNAAVALVNDLDLRLIDPNGVPHLPWTLNPQNPSAPAVRTAPNRLDNIEQVVVDNPIPGTWTVEVIGFNVPSGPQPFSIVGAGATTGVVMDLASPFPALVPPGQPVQIDLSITAVNQELVAGSTTVNYRYDSGEFQTVPLTSLGGDLYRATLPAPTCEQSLEVYFAAEGTFSGPITHPIGAPEQVHSAAVGVIAESFTDSFETDQGWTVVNIPAGTGPFTGQWERAIPIPATSAPLQDVDDTGLGYCYVTQNGSGNFDVDHGTTTLTSPRMNASGGVATISYWRWFVNSTGTEDVLRVEISGNDGASWQTLEVVGPSGQDAVGGWRFASHQIPPALATDQFRIRFTTSDLGTPGVVEAALDAVRLEVRSCENPAVCLTDWDGSGAINSADISAFLNSWLSSLNNNDLNADFDHSGSVNSADISAFLGRWLEELADGC